MKKNKTDWKALKIKTGSAARVPKLVKGLDELYYDRQAAFDKLGEVFAVGSQEWFDASAPAVDLLLSSSSEMLEPAYGLVMAAEIASGGHTRFWAAGKASKADPACVDMLLKHRELIWNYLSDTSALTRAAASVVLSVMIKPEELEEITRLSQALEAEQDPLVRASLLLCLSCLESDEKFSARIQTFRNDSNGYLSGTATLCEMRQNLNWDLNAVSKGIEALLSLPPTTHDTDEGRWPWFEGIERSFSDALDYLDPAATALLAIVKYQSEEVKDHLVDLLFRVGEGSENILVRDRCSSLLLAFIGGMDRRKHPCLPSEFTQEQWNMVQRFVSSRLCSCDRYGMPAAGVIRRRWAGVDAPGPLDMLVENPVENQPQVPLWYAWIRYREINFYKRGMPKDPPQLGVLKDPLDYWQAMVEFSSGAYGTSTSFSEEECETILKSVTSDKNFFERVKQLVEEQVWRMENDNWVGNGLFSSTFVYLTLLPWIRAGNAVPDSWTRLIVFEDTNHCREIVNGLTEKERDQILLIRLSKHRSFMGFLNFFEDLDVLLPLMATPAVTSRLIEIMSEYKTELNKRSDGKAIVKKIAALAASQGFVEETKKTDKAKTPKAKATEKKPAAKKAEKKIKPKTETKKPKDKTPAAKRKKKK